MLPALLLKQLHLMHIRYHHGYTTVPDRTALYLEEENTYGEAHITRQTVYSIIIIILEFVTRSFTRTMNIPIP